jgi:hypothetical protein
MAITGGYSIDHNAAYAGMMADGQLANVISKLNTETANIPFGKGVVADGIEGAKLPTAATVAADFVGVAYYELNRAYADADTFGAVVDRDFSVTTVGPIWVLAAEAVTARQPVFLRVGSTNTGDFAAAAGTGATLSVEIPNAKFLTSADEGELVKVSFVVGG